MQRIKPTEPIANAVIRSFGKIHIPNAAIIAHVRVGCGAELDFRHQCSAGNRQTAPLRTTVNTNSCVIHIVTRHDYTGKLCGIKENIPRQQILRFSLNAAHERGWKCRSGSSPDVLGESALSPDIHRDSHKTL